MNSRSTKEHQDLKALDEMIEKITVDSYGDDDDISCCSCSDCGFCEVINFEGSTVTPG